MVDVPSDLDRAIRERLDDDEVRRLATAIRLHAHDEDVAEISIADSWRAFTRICMDEAGIELTDTEFRAAWRAMWRSAFIGGNYTQDARRVLKAARVAGERKEGET
ncbi:MAG TPA: hypothetical protein VHX38_02020 [Pseudonocardiaceae bacterium]|nr:hypothetical protein [Pseudonocardiaceae bacterium]